MFSLREFIKRGFLEAVGHYPDYWIIINAGGHYQQGTLIKADLAEIQAKIDEKNTLEPEEPSENDGSFVEPENEEVE